MSVSPCNTGVSEKFEFIPQLEDDFLQLFPFRHHFLWAKHPDPGQRPQWKTEDRHPLSDRLIRQASYLYGVRFGEFTHYLMLDIDRRSAYHPCRNPLAISEILAALEPLNLIAYVAVSSSDSGGIHLYFPFGMGQVSWKIARAVALLLESKGFKLDRGQLEVFPNPRKLGGVDFNGHRLPLQQGSYLLNETWQPIFTAETAFLQQWRWCDHRNTVSEQQVEFILKTYERKPYRLRSGRAQKFLNDLNAEIEVGWTGFGQTNRLLGRIALREYIFRPVLNGCAPLTGKSLACNILETAVNLPGYEEFCRHRHEITDLCLYWARSVELSPRYFPYGGKKEVAAERKTVELTWNQQQALQARKRLEAAIADLQQQGLPTTARARMLALKAYGIGTSTLSKHRELWHPEYLKPRQDGLIHPIQAIQDEPETLKPAQEELIHPTAQNKLSLVPARDSQNREAGEGNDLAVGGARGGFPQVESSASAAPPAPYLAGLELVKAALKRAESYSQQRRQPDPLPSCPDEHWWAQLQLKGVLSG